MDTSRKYWCGSPIPRHMSVWTIQSSLAEALRLIAEFVRRPAMMVKVLWSTKVDNGTPLLLLVAAQKGRAVMRTAA